MTTPAKKGGSRVPEETPSKRRRKTEIALPDNIIENGYAFVWGCPDMGQCGPVHQFELTKPWPLYRREKTDEEVADKTLKPPHFFSDIVCVASTGFQNALVTKENDKNVLYTWGCNDDAVLGRVTALTEEEKADLDENKKDNDDIRQCTPTPVALDDVVQMSVGNHHMIALTGDGNVWGWGIYKDDDGFIGFDPKVMSREQKRVKPMKVPGLPKGQIARIASSANVTLALTTSGRVWEWGCTGQRVPRRCERLRQHTLNYNHKQLDPHQLIFHAPVEEIYAGGDHHFAIDANRQVWAWGINGWGQLGIGPKKAKCQEKPQKVLVLGKDIIQLACGSTHSLALSSEGKVYSWGRNSYGQCGYKPEKKVKIDLNNYVPKNTPRKHPSIFESAPPVETEVEPKVDLSSAFTFNSTPAAPATGGFTFGGSTESTPPATQGFTFTPAASNGSETPATGFTFGTTVTEKPTGAFTFESAPPKPESADDVKMDDSSAVFIFGAEKKPEPETPKKKKEEEEADENDFTWTPKEIPFFETLRKDNGPKVVFIGAGENHSMVITDDGKIYSFGFNEQSQLGLKTEQCEVFEPQMVPFGKTFDALICSGGAGHTILIATKKDDKKEEPKKEAPKVTKKQPKKEASVEEKETSKMEVDDEKEEDETPRKTLKRKNDTKETKKKAKKRRVA